MSNPYSSSDPKIGIIVPTLAEQKCLSRRNPHQVGYEAICGMGKVNAALSATRAIFHEACDAILLVGFCGAVAGAKIGDVVHAYMMIEADFNAGILEEPWPRLMKNEIIKGLPGEGATFLTMDQFLKDPGMWDKFCSKGPCVVDMETWGAAQACDRFTARFAAVRVVSDVVGSNSEQDFIQACKTLGPILNKATEEAVAAIRRAYGKD